MPENDKRVNVAWTEVHDLFEEISDYFGYTVDEYEEDLIDLISIWNTQKYLEIYQERKDFQYGRIKDSSKAKGAVPHYLGLFHVRLVQQETDPLVVVVFDKKIDEGGNEVKVASLRFMIHHDDIFGEKSNKQKNTRQKRDPAFMKDLRKRVDDFIQKGNS